MLDLFILAARVRNSLATMLERIARALRGGGPGEEGRP